MNLQKIIKIVAGIVGIIAIIFLVRIIGTGDGFGTAEELASVGAHEVHHDYASLGASLDAFAERLS